MEVFQFKTRISIIFLNTSEITCVTFQPWEENPPKNGDLQSRKMGWSFNISKFNLIHRNISIIFTGSDRIKLEVECWVISYSPVRGTISDLTFSYGWWMDKQGRDQSVVVPNHITEERSRLLSEQSELLLRTKDRDLSFSQFFSSLTPWHVSIYTLRE